MNRFDQKHCPLHTHMPTPSPHPAYLSKSLDMGAHMQRSMIRNYFLNWYYFYSCIYYSTTEFLEERCPEQPSWLLVLGCHDKMETSGMIQLNMQKVLSSRSPVLQLLLFLCHPFVFPFSNTSLSLKAAEECWKKHHLGLSSCCHVYLSLGWSLQKNISLMVRDQCIMEDWLQTVVPIF